MKNSNIIDHPGYYQRNGLEAIDIIEEYDMNFNQGSCFKYLWRMGLKYGEKLQKDEKKAHWYFDRESVRIAKRESITLEEAKESLFKFFENIFMRNDLTMVLARQSLAIHIGIWD